MSWLFALHYNLIMGKKCGQLFVEVVPVLEVSDTGNTYDWSNKKISLKINPSFLDQLLHGLEKGFCLKQEQNSKILEFSPVPVGYAMRIFDGVSSYKHTFSYAEIKGLVILLTKAKERIYGW